LANASAQLKLLPPLFRTSVGALAKTEKVCFADSDAPDITALAVSEGGITTYYPGCAVAKVGLLLPV